MPTGNQSRSDNASRAVEPRPARTTPIVETAILLGQTDDVCTKADSADSKRAFKVQSISAIHKNIFSALCEGQYGLLHLLPTGDDRDLMILAGHAAMLADQLPDLIPETDVHATKLAEGLKAALRTISATLADKWPAGPEAVEPLYPELGRCIRQDVLVTDALRADMEGR
jgi:hypothetical protein